MHGVLSVDKLRFRRKKENPPDEIRRAVPCSDGIQSLFAGEEFRAVTRTVDARAIGHGADRADLVVRIDGQLNGAGQGSTAGWRDLPATLAVFFLILRRDLSLLVAAAPCIGRAAAIGYIAQRRAEFCKEDASRLADPTGLDRALRGDGGRGGASGEGDGEAREQCDAQTHGERSFVPVRRRRREMRSPNRFTGTGQRQVKLCPKFLATIAFL